MRRSATVVASALLLAACGSGGNPTSSAAPTAPETVSAPAIAAVPSGTDLTDTSPTGTSPTGTSPTGTSPTGTNVPVDGVQPEGFERVAARVTEPDGSVCEICVWLAETADQRRRGLMSVTGLGPANAMAFVYPEPHTGTFWMKNTLLPLSIAFYAPTGAFLDSFDMEPCVADPCPTYPTADQFLVAVEVPQGGLDALGMVAGSTLELLDLPCD